ncbi:glycoside hydrolase [Macrophomina phaseolina]|uniref:Glycoside hydrolase n=1 Tax=Macrophomina phaseolina TaxID=35725 RepID=A0ABQ8GVQ5_9PEZI|nr:glycoside hydrolase [Macrophomina phaseolina]
MSLKSLAILAAGAASVNAHGVILDIVSAGKEYGGWDVNYQYYNPVPKVAAWAAGGYGHGPIVGTQYASTSINCHDDAKAAPIYMEAAAGSDIEISWGTPGSNPSPWPESHKGPIITYMAPCGTDATGDCTTVLPDDLGWTKVYQTGLLTGGDTSAQVWATDKLISENKTTVTIPSALAPGNYVMRHEIIALHAGGEVNGPQNYPQCYNVKVTGSGSEKLPAGTKGVKLYAPEDTVFNIYANIDSYPFPGPELWSGASSSSGTGANTTTKRWARTFRG